MNNLKEMRERAGLTQQDVAKRMNVAHNTISQWENGVRQPKAKQLPTLAAILHCRIDDLFVN